MKKIVEGIKTEKICSRLVGLRVRLGFKTPSAFAKELGIKYTTYLNYEKGRMPPTEFLFLLKRKYPRNVNIDELFVGSKYGQAKIAFPVSDVEGKYQDKCPFMDRDRAMRFKQELIYIEKESPPDYRRLWKDVICTAEDLRYEEKKLRKSPKIS